MVVKTKIPFIAKKQAIGTEMKCWKREQRSGYIMKKD